MTSSLLTIVLRLSARLTVAAALIILSLRDFLFGGGLYVYRDWSWPLSTSITPIGVFSPTILRNSFSDIFGLTRSFVTWPIVLIDGLTKDPALAEKAFIIYIFSIVVGLAFVFAEIMLAVLNRYNGYRLGILQGECFRLIVVIFCLANPWTLQALSGSYYTYVIEMLVFSISMLLIVLKNNFITLIIVGALISLCVFLDPDLVLFGLLIVFLTIIVTSLAASLTLKSVLLAIERILIVVALALPSLLTVLYGLTSTSGISWRSVDSITSLASNLSIGNAVRLFGSWWSMIAFGPPSILDNHTAVSALPYNGLMLLPVGFMTTLWLTATWFVPVVAFSSILFSKFRTLSATFIAVAAIGLMLSQTAIVPYSYLLTKLGNFPLLGGALLTTFAVLDHVLVIAASAYIVLVSITIYKLLVTPQSTKERSWMLSETLKIPSLNRVRRNLPKFRYVIIILVAFFLILPSWQFFSGSFYPAGYTGDTIAGNGIPSVGAFSPSTVPSDMIQVYDWLLAQPGNYNIYWPGPNGGTYEWNEKSSPSITLVDSPKPALLTPASAPQEFPAPLKYLIGSGFEADIAAYLDALNMKYLVVQPLSNTDMLADWGVGDIQSLQNILDNSQGLYVADVQGNITVYGTKGLLGSTYVPDIVENYDTGDFRYALGYGILSSLNIHATFVGENLTKNNLCFDKLQCSISILSPSYLSKIPNLNLQTLSNTSFGPLSETLNQSNSFLLGNSQDPWLVNNWGPSNVNAQVEGNTMRWTFLGPTYQSLSYNCTGIDGQACGIQVPPGSIATIHISFNYRTSENFNSSVQVAVSCLNNTLQTIAFPASPVYQNSQDWRTVTWNISTPSNTEFLTPRIQTRASAGWIEISNVSMTVNFLQTDQNAPFGDAISINGIRQNLGAYQGNIYVQYKGVGSLNIGNYSLIELNCPNRFTWATLKSSANDSLVATGKLEISTILISKSTLNPVSGTSFSANQFVLNSTQSVVYAVYFVPGYSLTGNNYRAFPTLDGLNVFLNVGPGKYTETYSPLLVLQVSYLLVLGLDLSIITIGIMISSGTKKSRFFLTRLRGRRVLFR